MVLDSSLSPHRRSQNTSSPSFSVKKQLKGHDDLEWSILLERHRFLLTMLVLLVLLCTVYLYFAVTLGGTGSCSSLSGADKVLCQAKSSSIHNGKLKFF
ncbi:hypothetical protein COCNU_01G004060 [Cocos nucifera]|uniref:Uncharacterized protein n=1 Tax=Cocos nucifera TaxID=13894 RepID=A0A8K0MU51_COCNU|nr:hypothetical protein COCNU_01G004060 [Cocos nucifera]